MNIFNAQMAKFIDDYGRRPSFDLPKDLKGLLDSGFVDYKAGHFFKQFFSDVSREVLDRGLVTELSEYEYSVNGFHIEDYCSQNDVFAVAFAFLEYFCLKWEMGGGRPSCSAILAFQEDSEFGRIAKFSFYVNRPGERVIDKNAVEEFNQPLLIREMFSV